MENSLPGRTLIAEPRVQRSVCRSWPLPVIRHGGSTDLTRALSSIAVLKSGTSGSDLGLDTSNPDAAAMMQPLGGMGAMGGMGGMNDFADDF